MQAKLRSNSEKTQEHENMMLSMDSNIRQLQDEMKKAALYEELMVIDKKLKKLPEMQKVN